MVLLLAEQPNGKYKEWQGAEGAGSSESQKAHPTIEFIVVLQNGSHVLLHLVSSLVTMVSE